VICPKTDVVIDEYSLDKPLMFFSIAEKMHGIHYRAINMVAIAGKVSANQGVLAT
jgi:hypothetical protein